MNINLLNILGFFQKHNCTSETPNPAVYEYDIHIDDLKINLGTSTLQDISYAYSIVIQVQEIFDLVSLTI